VVAVHYGLPMLKFLDRAITVLLGLILWRPWRTAQARLLREATDQRAVRARTLAEAKDRRDLERMGLTERRAGEILGGQPFTSEDMANLLGVALPTLRNWMAPADNKVHRRNAGDR
jgi:hypothetical protein